jgi:tetratricopeptide (TPR) repeat protein
MNAALWWAAVFSGSLLAAPGERCLRCHADQVSAFRKSGMGRSVDLRPALQPATFYHRLSNRHYTIRENAIRRHQLDSAGRPVNVVEKSVTFSIGSGNHAVTYIHRTPEGRLLELPLSYYAQLSGYAMSPGYNRPDHLDFRREISDSCLFCHSASREPRPIDCERCHGDSREHLATPAEGSILNPARLAPRAKLEVCLQCHLETTSTAFADSLRLPGREAFSYRPGEPLQQYKLYFDRIDRSDPGRFEINHAGYRLLQSACFQKSTGRLTCTTCHDPHSARLKANACQSCHRSSHARETADCASCHMPKRSPVDAIHTAMTDHLIELRPRFAQPTQEDYTPYRGEIRDFYTKSDPLTRAVMNIREATPEAVNLYRKYLARYPDHIPTLASLGKMLVQRGQGEQAIAFLNRVLEIDPKHVEALNSLAVAHALAGRQERALQLLRQCVATNPDHSLSWINLGQALEVAGKLEDAIQAYTEAIRLQPDSSEARQRLQRLISSWFRN